MSKREYLTQLMRQHPDWIRGSMTDPSPSMTRIHVALHAIALRRMTSRGGTMNSLHDFGPAFRARAQRNEKKYSGYWLFACGAMYTLWLVMLFDGAVSL